MTISRMTHSRVTSIKMTFSRITMSRTNYGRKTLIGMTHIRITYSILIGATTLGIMTHSKKGLFPTLNINDTYQKWNLA